MAGRSASVTRETAESKVSISVNLDGSGAASVATGVGFLDHMLAQIARHGGIDLDVAARGDLVVDAHHTVEDIGIALGRAIGQALGDRVGLRRMGDATVPLDEALAVAAVDISGRGDAFVELHLAGERVGEMDADLLRHFLEGLAREARITLHIRVLAGTNDHHRAEAAFKALARALGEAVQLDPRRVGQVPSTKGVIDA